MKSRSILFILMSILLIFLSGCSSSPKISTKEEFNISQYRIKVDSAEVKDNNLTVYAKWSFGYNEDSMKKKKFASTGILFYATQNGKELKNNLDNSNIYDEVYEKNEGHLYPKFELINTKDPIELTFYKASTNQEKKINITLK